MWSATEEANGDDPDKDWAAEEVDDEEDEGLDQQVKDRFEAQQPSQINHRQENVERWNQLKIIELKIFYFTFNLV